MLLFIIIAGINANILKQTNVNTNYNDMISVGFEHERQQLPQSPPIVEKHTVKMIYMIPSDNVARPNYQKTITEISVNLQNYYGTQLGRTFCYESQNIDLINIDVTQSELREGSKILLDQRRFLEDGTTDERRNVIQYFINYIKDNHSFERDMQKIIFIGIIEIEAFWVALGGAGFIGIGGQELDLYEQYRRPNIIVPFEHELGHALGLLHTNETLDCLREFFPNLKWEYTFMEATSIVPTIDFVQPMLDYERQLLLDPNYIGVECLGLLQARPHPSKYFQRTNIDINSDGFVDVEDLATLLVNWGPCDFPNCIVGDFNCDRVNDVNDLAQLLVNWKIK